MENGPTQFTVTLRFVPESAPVRNSQGQLQESRVCFKRDGGRFEETNTLKLAVENTYRLVITLKPDTVKFRELCLKDKQLEVRETHEEESTRLDAKLCTKDWEPTKSSKRELLKFSLLVSHGEVMDSLTLPVQCKLYKVNDKNHLVWGQPLEAIRYDCKVTEQSTIICGSGYFLQAKTTASSS